MSAKTYPTFHPIESHNENRTGVAVLGATGSIGRSTVDLLSQSPNRFRVVALTAQKSVPQMLALCQQFHPEVVVMVDPAAAQQLTEQLNALKLNIVVLSGVSALERAATWPGVDVVVAGVVGFAGLPAIWAAIVAHKRIVFVNKEPLIAAGALLMDHLRQHPSATLLPADSEHNGVFQCMPAGYTVGMRAESVDHLTITASGGPFRTWTREEMKSVTPAMAVKHPNWSMGAKITVDSATMMNKGLEWIEAYWLFGLPQEDIRVVVHPQSIIHGWVQYKDGSIISHMGAPDMRVPIGYGLAYPERLAITTGRIDLAKLGHLDFEPMDEQRFPCFQLAKQALRQGPAHTVALNAANEVAVAAFLAGEIPFLGIAALIESVLALTPVSSLQSLDDVIHLDAECRSIAQQQVHTHEHAY
ncbi:MAG: 1-deoxy-D-xylulose-5-phosphate reductoisomerase [Pseudomonadota bacterium]